MVGNTASHGSKEIHTVGKCLAQIREGGNLDAGYWFSDKYRGEKVPSFEEVLKLVKGKAKLNVEIKSSSYSAIVAGKVVELIQKYSMEDECVITSFDYDALLEMTQIGKECHSHCEIFKRMGECIMPREGVFAVVLRGGTIQKGDTIELVTEK